MDYQLPGYVTPLIRQALALLSGFLVGKGVIDAETATAIGGAILAIVPIAWSVFSRMTTRQVIKDAIAAPAGQARP